MINKLIKTEKDYELALSRIDELMDAVSGTPEVDELELLTTLVEMYEDKHYPINLPDPIDAIKFRMEQMGLNQQNLVPFIGSKSKVSEVLNRKRPLTLSIMRGLQRGLGIPAEVLLQEPGKDFPADIPDLDWARFPVVEMAKRKWITNNKNIKGNEEEIIRDFIKDAGGIENVSSLLFRKSTSPRQNKNTDIYALNAWCLRVLSLAHKQPLDTKYIPDSVGFSELRDIVKLSYLYGGALLAKEYLEKHGIYLIIVRHLPRTYLDGASILLKDGTPIIALTLRYDRIDNFWFCLLHELAHIIKHLSKNKREVIIDDLDLRGHQSEIKDKIEGEADDLAKKALIPEEYWQKFVAQENITNKAVREFSKQIKIHPAIVAGRIRFEKNNYKLLSHFVGRGEVRKHFSETFKD